MKGISSRFKRVALVMLPVFVVVSCVTINIYFPAAAVEKAADRIVEEVWGADGGAPEGGNGAVAPESSIKESRWYAALGDIRIGVSEAHAAEPDIDVTTPAIRALKSSIQGRAEGLKAHLSSGSVGINNEGFLEILSTKGMELKAKAKLKRLVKSENVDRGSLYVEIAKANNIDVDKVPDIKKLFAKSWKKNAKSGWWLQDEAGKWAKKP